MTLLMWTKEAVSSIYQLCCFGKFQDPITKPRNARRYSVWKPGLGRVQSQTLQLLSLVGPYMIPKQNGRYSSTVLPSRSRTQCDNHGNLTTMMIVVRPGSTRPNPCVQGWWASIRETTATKKNITTHSILKQITMISRYFSYSKWQPQLR